jgi:hypothetical protein
VGTRLSNDKYSTVSYAPHGFLFWPSTESTDICLRAVSTQDGAEQTVPFVDPSSWYATLLKKGHIIHVQNDGAGKVVRLVNPAINQVIPLNKPGNGRVSVWMNGEDWAYIYSASTGFTGGLIKNNHHHTNNFSLPEIAIHELLFVPGKTQVVFRYATMDRTPGWLAPWLERWGWQQYSPFRSISYFGLYDWATGEWLAEWRAPQRTPFMQISADGTQLGVSWHDSDNDSALHIDRYDLSEPRYSRWWARIAAGSAFFLSTGLVLRLRRRQPSFAYAQRLEDKVR